MGMSASQARLLSITARLTDNELHSQLITNAKIRLASKSADASDEYMNALSATKLEVATYDDNGTATYTDLTANYLSTYGELKNQYSITSASGKNMVTAVDAQNYKETDSLSDFLKRYGLISTDVYDKEMADYNTQLATYNTQMATYLTEEADYEKLEAQYLIDYANYQTQLAAYNEALNKPNLYNEFTSIVGTSTAPKSCYSNTLKGGDLVCYEHVLAHLIDYDGTTSPSNKTYTTSISGKTINPTTDFFNPYYNLIDGSAIHGAGLDTKFVPVSKEMCDNETAHHCDLDDDFSGIGDTTKSNSLENIISGGNPSTMPQSSDLNASNNWSYTVKYDTKPTTLPTDNDVLLSDWTYKDNGDGSFTYSLKTVKQKAIDLLYALHEGTINNTNLKSTLINFTDGDMKSLGVEEPKLPDAPTAPVKPVAPTKPDAILQVNDKPKSQWYINLWYLMNGSDTANKIKTETDDDGKTYYKVDAADKAKGNKQNYEVIDDKSASDPSWLKYALEQGLVTLKKTLLNVPSETSTSIAEADGVAINWENVIYTSATDISSQEDTLAQTKAEAKYEKATKEIQAKDKEYDSKLKNLETQHSALQTEYDSIKTVLSKNVERSFKTFSS